MRRLLGFCMLFTAVYSLASFLALPKLEVQHPSSIANGQDGLIEYVLEWARANCSPGYCILFSLFHSSSLFPEYF